MGHRRFALALSLEAVQPLPLHYVVFGDTYIGDSLTVEIPEAWGDSSSRGGSKRVAVGGKFLS